jgi:hypothetical protein
MGNHALRGTLDACAVQCCWPRHWPAACRGHAFHALVNALPATQMSSHNRCSQCEMHATLVHCKTTLFECSQGKLHTPCVAGAGPARQASTDKGHAYVIDFMSSATVELSLQQLSPRDTSQQAQLLFVINRAVLNAMRMLPTHAHTRHEKLHVAPADKDLATNNNFVTTNRVAAVMGTVGVTRTRQRNEGTE